MGLFRPYERTAPSDGASAGRLSELNPKGAKPPRTGSTRVAAEPTPAPPVPEQAPEQRPGERTQVTRTPAKKVAPTPTRKQAEAERMARLHPTLTPKEQRKRDREAKFQARQDAWDRVENSPSRLLARDYVDARWTITEFMFPAMILVLALMIATMGSPLLSLYLSLGMWVLLLMVFVNVFLLWRGFRKLLDQRLPDTNRKGLLMYIFNRALMVRRFRRPGPRVERGASI